MLEEIDRAALRYCEAACQWIERYTSLSNFTIARFMAVAWAAGAVAMVSWRDGNMRIAWAVLALLLVATLPVTFWTIRFLEKETERGFANCEKITSGHAVNRTIQLAVMLLALGISLPFLSITPYDVGMVACVIHFYARACQPLPPSEQFSWDKDVVPNATH